MSLRLAESEERSAGPRNVFVVTFGFDYEGSDVKGVRLSPEKAEALASEVMLSQDEGLWEPGTIETFSFLDSGGVLVKVWRNGSCSVCIQRFEAQ